MFAADVPAEVCARNGALRVKFANFSWVLHWGPCSFRWSYSASYPSREHCSDQNHGEDEGIRTNREPKRFGVCVDRYDPAPTCSNGPITPSSVEFGNNEDRAASYDDSCDRMLGTFEQAVAIETIQVEALSYSADAYYRTNGSWDAHDWKVLILERPLWAGRGKPGSGRPFRRRRSARQGEKKAV